MRITNSMINNTHALIHSRNQALIWGNRVPQGSEQQLNTMLINAATFVLNAGPRATSLRNTLAHVPNTVGREIPRSDDMDVVRPRPFTGQTVPETKITVHQLAASQRNEGTALPANETTTEAGTFRFEIEMDGETHTMFFNTAEPLTNRAFQQRMAQVINQSAAPINATVTNGPDGTSILNLEATATGAGTEGEPRFTIRDTQGNAVEATGADTITREGQNASFTLNDDEEPRSSASNDISLPGNVPVTLSGVGEATISAGRDVLGTEAAVRQMVSDINALLQTTRANQSDNRTRALMRSLETQLNRSRNGLQQIGITRNNQGLLVINDEQLRTATENGTTARVLGNNNNRPNSFVTNLHRTADSVARNPVHHINQRIPRMPAFSSALHAVANPQAINQQIQPSPFDAYFPNDPWGGLWSGVN